MNTQSRHIDPLWPDYSFATIDKGIANLRSTSTTGMEAKALPAAPGERGARLLGIYAAVRPILAVLSAVPLIPPTWREVLRLFVVTLDELAASPDPGAEFKAGKDLME